jgi:microcystin-dependent protein
MAASNFYTTTTLTSAGVLIDPSSAIDGAALMYKTASSAFVATVRAVPVGTIRMYASPSTPTNYIICNGQSLNTFTYKTLHAVISNKYGGTAYLVGTTDQSGAATTFTLPNLISTVLPYASNANTSLTTSINIGATSQNIDHSHGFPITLTAGAGTTTHNHTSTAGNQTINAVTANHTHTWADTTQFGGAHTHTIQGTSASHTHVYIRSNAAQADSTSNAVNGHTHGNTAPNANHNHTANSGDTHTHSTNPGGANHSSHNYQMTSNAATLSHSHTSNSITGIYFYIRYQ